METEYLSFDNCSEREIVEKIGEVFPHICVAVLPQTLVVEAVDLSDLPRFVVASENGDPVLESDFETNQ
jgi:hypothetical protein